MKVKNGKRKREIENAIEIVKEACDLLIDIIPGLDSPICCDHTMQLRKFTVRIILDHKEE